MQTAETTDLAQNQPPAATEQVEQWVGEILDNGDMSAFRKLRESREISQRRLCEMLGFGRNTIYRWEAEQTKPEPDLLSAAIVLLAPTSQRLTEIIADLDAPSRVRLVEIATRHLDDFAFADALFGIEYRKVLSKLTVKVHETGSDKHIKAWLDRYDMHEEAKSRRNYRTSERNVTSIADAGAEIAQPGESESTESTKPGHPATTTSSDALPNNGAASAKSLNTQD